MTDFPVLPGSQCCVGCGELTFRARPDQLCPRCAYEAEHLIEQIEIDCLSEDLALLTRFDAYCRDRDERRLLQAAQVRAERIANRGLTALPPIQALPAPPVVAAAGASAESEPAPLLPLPVLLQRRLVESGLFHITPRPLTFPERDSA